MSKRRKQKTTRYGSDYDAHSDSDFSDAPDSDSYDEYTEERRPKKRAKRQSPEKKPSTPQVKARTNASIASLATDTLPNHESASASERLSKIDGAVLARIKKALALAHHEKTGEQEAKAALRMAAKLMSQHSINQADVLAEENKAERMKRAGMSVVSIRNLFDADAAVRCETWISTLSKAMTVFFDCKVYSTSFCGGARLEWTFYGLAEHTVAAAYAFEMAYNLILEWSQARQAGQGRREKTTYRLGVSDGLCSLARKGKAEEKQLAIQTEKRRLEAACHAEEEEKQARLKRLEQPAIVDDTPPESQPVGENVIPLDTKVKIEEVDDEDIIIPALPAAPCKDEVRDELPAEDQDGTSEHGFRGQSLSYGGSPAFQPDFDDSDDDVDLIDLDAAEPKYQPRVRPSVVETPGIAGPSVTVGNLAPAIREDKMEEKEAQWKSVQQLVAFRDTSVAIADDFLKAQNVKLSIGRKSTRRGPQTWKEVSLYRQGREDAKKIDVRRNRIKGTEDDY